MSKEKFIAILLVVLVSIFLIVGISSNVTSVYGNSTDVSGIIGENTTWTLENSPYVLTANVLVDEGVTLAIVPGVTVHFGDYFMTVAGTLLAIGNETDRVVMTGSGNAYTGEWNGRIVFLSTSTDSIIDYAEITSMPELMIGIYESSPTISNNIISDSTSGAVRSHAIRVLDGSPIITGNLISQCRGISIGGTTNREPVVVTDNIIVHNDIGIFLTYDTSSSFISGNIISHNIFGIVTEAMWSDATITENLIVNNYGNLQGVYPWPHITEGGGITLIQGLTHSMNINNNTIYNNTYGVDIHGSPSSPILHNNIFRNINQNIRNNLEQNVNASSNWWGTTNTSLIDQNIYDFYDDYWSGKVNYLPILDSLNPYAPTPPLSGDFSHTPLNLYAHGMITFDASTSLGEYSTIANYTWDWGDTNVTTQNTPIAMHSYADPGNYNVTLTVTDEWGFQNSTSTILTVLEDTTPPITTDDYDGTWHTSGFITLSTIDDESGVAETYYRINDGAIKSVSDDGQPFITTENDNNTLEYWSVNNAGNEEFPHKILTKIKLDKTSPVIGELTQPPEEVQSNQPVSIGVEVQDSTSGVKNVTLSYTTDDGESWVEVPMIYDERSNTFQASIPEQTENTLVKFRIAACDDAGNVEVENNSGQYYVYTVIPELQSWGILPLFFMVTLITIIIKRKLFHPP